VPVIVGVTFVAVGPMVVINLEEKPNNLSRSSSSGSFRISSVAFSWLDLFRGAQCYFNGARGLATHGFDPWTRPMGSVGSSRLHMTDLWLLQPTKI
jgi:hypothetical protein